MSNNSYNFLDCSRVQYLVFPASVNIISIYLKTISVHIYSKRDVCVKQSL